MRSGIAFPDTGIDAAPHRPTVASPVRPFASVPVVVAADVIAIFLACAFAGSGWRLLRAGVTLPGFTRVCPTFGLLLLAYAVSGLYARANLGAVERLGTLVSMLLNRWIKRALDIVTALVVGALSLPLLAVSSLWVKWASGGSAFYWQEREGEDGRSILVPKLRTMYPDAEKMLTRVLSESPEIRAEWTCRFKLKQDPRILPGVGKFLRRTSLDELPQLWSVLIGEMSLVGPRPFPRYHLNAFSPRFRALRGRVRPGLTGLWQVSDRSDGDLRVQETLDTYYIRNWSFWLDISILARTVRAVLFARGAY